MGHAVKTLLPRKARGGMRRTQRKLEVQQFENLPYQYQQMPPLSKRQDFRILRTVLVRQPPRESPIALVDCGSGSTRALFFQDDGKSHVSWEKSAWRGSERFFF